VSLSLFSSPSLVLLLVPRLGEEEWRELVRCTNTLKAAVVSGKP
jgi:hypothetical protein